MLVIATILIYFAALWLISRLSSRGGNEAFFTAGRKSPWPLVAFGMIGASISGVTFIGVPGWVMSIDMTYMQMCLGFIVGYLIVAFVLLPIYYKASNASIYSFLNQRLGSAGHSTGASAFIVSKMLGAAAKFYVVCEILQACFHSAFNLPLSTFSYFMIAAVALLMIWLYTRRGGMRTLVWTDALQTLCLITALILILIRVTGMLDMSVADAVSAVWRNPHSRMFEWGDWQSSQHFVKQFLSGVFVVIVMTGLDQDMMQKNLTCKSLKDAQKDMCAYGLMFAPVNFLFMALGILLLMLYAKLGIDLPAKGDALLADIVLDGTLGTACVVVFTIGVVASAFSSADSALTSLTTSFTIDILEKESDEHTRKVVHALMLVAFTAVTLAFHALGTGSVMDLIYTLVSYTYGPLLGLFVYAMISPPPAPPERGEGAIRTGLSPRSGGAGGGLMTCLVCIAAPMLCYGLDCIALHYFSYKFGYEILLLNGLLTFAGLWAASKPHKLVTSKPEHAIR